MNRLSNKCRLRREAISLLACGELPHQEKREAESHLAECADCRTYYAELKKMVAPLAGWKQSLAQVEPTPAVQVRWSKAVRSAATGASDASETSSSWWSEIIWPARHAWGGIAAVWLVMWALNWERPTFARADSSATHAPTQIMLQARAEQRRLLAELIPLVETSATKPPPHNPQPRSERHSTSANS